MRSILIAMLLIIAVIWIYSETLGGISGTGKILDTHAQKASETIRNIDP